MNTEALAKALAASPLPPPSSFEPTVAPPAKHFALKPGLNLLSLKKYISISPLPATTHNNQSEAAGPAANYDAPPQIIQKKVENKVIPTMATRGNPNTTRTSEMTDSATRGSQHRG